MREPGGSVNTLRAPIELSTPIKVVLATLFVGAGAIHLAMAPIHAGGSTTEAVGFAIAGWLQIAVAIGIIVHGPRGSCSDSGSSSRLPSSVHGSSAARRGFRSERIRESPSPSGPSTSLA